MRKWIEVIGEIIFAAATVFAILSSVSNGFIFLAVGFVFCFVLSLIIIGVSFTKWKAPYYSQLSKKSIKAELVIHSLGFILSMVDCYLASNWMIAASGVCFLVYFSMWIVENIIELRRK